MSGRKKDQQLTMIPDPEGLVLDDLATVWSRPTCHADHQTTLQEHLQDLPRSQKVAHRHICAACAFESGYQRGRAEGYREAMRHVQSAIEKKAKA